MDLNVKKLWESLAPSNDILNLLDLPEIKCFSCSLAKDEITNRLVFIIKYKTVSSFSKNLKFKGVHISHLKESDFGDNMLTIMLQDNTLLSVYYIFIQNIVDELLLVNNEKQGLNIIASILVKWKKLFDKVSVGLSKEQEKGLLGELILLKMLMTYNSVEAALACWGGPNGDDKDFTLTDNKAIEVKFISHKALSISISNEDQLDTSFYSKLGLLVIEGDIVASNGLSLNKAVQSIRAIIGNNQKYIDLFDNQLNKVGYFEVDEEQYNTNYHIRDINLYHIVDAFPRLTYKMYPNDVFNVSYSIKRNNLKSFIIDFESFMNL